MILRAIRGDLFRLARRGFASASVVLAVVSATLMFTMAPAYAVDDGSDPNSTGCAGSNAWTPYFLSVSDPAGLLELRFSWACDTAWARFTCHQSGGCTEYGLYVRRDTDAVRYTDSVSLPFSTGNGEQLYTMQLNDGTGVTAEACIANFNTGVTVCTSSY